MICTTLFKRDIKSNYKLWLILAAVITMYSVMIIWMFDPEMEAMLNQMAASMPQVFAAFGMLEAGNTLTEFISNYLYGFLLVVMPLVMTIIMANKLVAKYVDNGSMAYLLASPVKRRTIINTQIIFICLAQFLLVLYNYVLCLCVSEWLFKGALDIKAFTLINVGCMCLHVFLIGVCFICSCIFNDSGKAIGTGAGICIAFLLIQMLSQVGDKLEKLKYATPLTLFDTKGLIAFDNAAYIKIAILFVAGIILLFAGREIFNKRDIPV